jgi:hypothetical protein
MLADDISLKPAKDIHKVPAFLGCSKRDPIFDLLMRQQLAGHQVYFSATLENAS